MMLALIPEKIPPVKKAAQGFRTSNSVHTAVASAISNA